MVKKIKELKEFSELNRKIDYIMQSKYISKKEKSQYTKTYIDDMKHYKQGLKNK